MIIAVDTGGTKTLVASFNRNGERLKTIKFSTPVIVKDYVTTLRATLDEHFSDQPIDVISLALPGLVEGTTAKWFGNLPWTDFDAKSALSGILNNATLLVENDANLAGLAETRQLTPTPFSSLYVTISTGIGTGLIINGKIDLGLKRSEAGHMMLEHNGQFQQWESFASGKAIYNTYNKFARDITDEKDWETISKCLCQGFVALIPVIQPDIIIIGGSIGTYFERYCQILERLINERLPAYINRPPLHQAKSPEEAVIHGCYYYALDYLNSK